MKAFLAANLRFPEKAYQQKVEGDVYVAYIIRSNGSIANPEILKGIGAGCDEEVIRMVKTMPKFKPGYQGETPVAVKVNQKIAFYLNGGAEPSSDYIGEVFTIVEKNPEFPGGEQAFNAFIANNLRYPEEAKKKGIAGDVYVKYIIRKNGSIANPEILKGLGAGCDEEAIRLVKALPKYKPGAQQGDPVAVAWNQRIKFRLVGNAKAAESDEVYTVAEQAPEFPGGDKNLNAFLAKNIRYPEEARKQKVEGDVFVNYIVRKDGSIVQPIVIKGIGAGCDEEAIRLVKAMPKFTPGSQSGAPVAVRCNQIIKFRLDGNLD
ncbi:energy transducer TonB [Fibrella aquatica]|uniref:energy transducer TonB n=1 Tax=Fibrella aquatica TaxID=3242487 RepID=UPI003522C7F5